MLMRVLPTYSDELGSASKLITEMMDRFCYSGEKCFKFWRESCREEPGMLPCLCVPYTFCAARGVNPKRGAQLHSVLLRSGKQQLCLKRVCFIKTQFICCILWRSVLPNCIQKFLRKIYNNVLFHLYLSLNVIKFWLGKCLVLNWW